jgi:hypothetical protein
MLRFFLTLTVVVATLGGAAVAVEAQPATPDPMNTSATQTPTGETSTIQLSETMQIDEWRYENATFYVTISSEAYTALTVTDAGKLSQALSEGDGAASTSIRQRTTRLDPDSTTTVVFRATEVDGAAAVTLTAGNSDQLILLRSDDMGGDRRPVEWQTTAGLVLLAAAGAAYWTYREAKKRWEDEKKEVSRIA